jgi:integrase
MAKALTPISIAALRARPHRYEVSDGGCHGLRVVVFPSRRKSFILRFRFRGLQRKLTLGPVLLTHNGEGEPDSAPEIDTPLSLAAARELATRALRQARSGQDPTEAKRRKREEQHAAEADTFEAVAEEYLRREGPRMRTVGQRRADLELFYPTLGRLPLDQIRRGQFTRILDTIADTRGPVRADRALSALRTLLKWHAGRGEYINVLAPGGRRTSISERARSRVLSDDELRAIWLAAEKDKGPFGGFLRFVLCTATRRSEAAALRHGELLDDGTTWIIPGTRYKNKRDTLIPLSKMARDIIAAQPVLGDYVFSADGSRPMGGFDDRKAEFDERAGVTGYVLHDLRRTSRTLLSRAGVSADIAEMCLGHALTGVRGTYDRHAYEHEKRHAFEALAAQIEKIVRPPEPVVADLAAERGKRRRP